MQLTALQETEIQLEATRRTLDDLKRELANGLIEHTATKLFNESQAENKRLRAVLQEIANEAQGHAEYNPTSGQIRLPRGYTKILNMADGALRRSNTACSQPSK